jgi:hypothetical protein
LAVVDRQIGKSEEKFKELKEENDRRDWYLSYHFG